MKVRTSRSLRAALTALCLATFTAGCGGDDSGASGGNEPSGSSDGEQVFHVVPVGDLTGPLAATSNAYAAGFRSYLEYKDFELSGYQIDLSDPIDTKTDTAATPGEIRKAIAADPDLMVGFISTAGMVASESVLETAGIPLMVGGDAGPLHPPAHDWFFTSGPRLNELVDANLAFLEAELGGLEGKRLAIVRSESGSSSEFLPHVQQLSEALGFEIVADETSPADAASFASQAANVARANPEGVIMIASADITVVQAKALVDAGVDVPIANWEGGSADVYLEAIDAPNFYAGRSYPTPTNPSDVWDAAVAAGVEENANNPFFSRGWAAGVALEGALASCGEGCDGDGLKKAFEEQQDLEIPGDLSFGPLNYSAEDHSGMQFIQFFQWDSSEGVSVEVGELIDVTTLGA